MRMYKFVCIDEEDSSINMEFETESECWDFPMEKFFQFLKGNGFVFGNEDQIGVMQDNKFRPADPYNQF